MLAKYETTHDLQHHGIKGQKWGDRKYQYKDGSLTALGRIHYGYGVKKHQLKTAIENKIKQHKAKEVAKQKSKAKAAEEDAKKKQLAAQEAEQKRREAFDKQRAQVLKNIQTTDDAGYVYANRKYLTNQELNDLANRYNKEVVIRGQIPKLKDPTKKDKLYKFIDDVSEGVDKAKKVYDSYNKARGILEGLGIVGTSGSSSSGNASTNSTPSNNRNQNNSNTSSSSSNSQSTNTQTSSTPANNGNWRSSGGGLLTRLRNSRRNAQVTNNTPSTANSTNSSSSSTQYAQNGVPTWTTQPRTVHVTSPGHSTSPHSGGSRMSNPSSNPVPNMTNNGGNQQASRTRATYPGSNSGSNQQTFTGSVVTPNRNSNSSNSSSGSSNTRNTSSADTYNGRPIVETTATENPARPSPHSGGMSGFGGSNNSPAVTSLSVASTSTDLMRWLNGNAK